MAQQRGIELNVEMEISITTEVLLPVAQTVITVSMVVMSVVLMLTVSVLVL